MDNFRIKFLEEASEHIEDLEQALLQLENDPGNKELIERVFRAMHSLKGGGAMFGFERVSEFTHNLENIYDLLRNDQLKLSKELLDVTLLSVDHLKQLLEMGDQEDSEVISNHEKLIAQIKGAADVKASENEMANAMAKNEEDSLATYYIMFQPNENIFDNGTNPLYLLDELVGLGKVKVVPHMGNIPVFDELDPTKCYIYWEVILATSESVNDITDVFIFVEDDCTLEINKLSNHSLLEDISFVNKLDELVALGASTIINDINKYLELNKGGKKQKENTKTADKNAYTKEHTISSIRVSSEKLDLLMNLVSEMVTTQARLSLYAEQKDDPELLTIAENVMKLTRQLRDNAFSIVLIPVENMLTRFQRLVRDLSGELGKQVVFKAEGVETELDKTIIENLTDPLLHILRNSLDHGIEAPGTREAKGKPAEGTILLKAFYSGANVIIQVIDDGAGIDPAIVKAKAVEKELISPDANLGDKEIYELIFMPGFSTALGVTDVSGRGVGMDVVKRKIHDIRGEVELDSELGKGTTITIKLPLTLSIIDGLLVRIDDSYYIVPLSAVEKIYAAKHQEFENSYNDIVVLDGNQVPYFYLRDEFGLQGQPKDTEQIVVISYEQTRIGLVVDNVVGEYQAVLKPLGKHYKNQEIMSGATILGDGTVALVMDTNKAVKFFTSKISQKEVKDEQE